MTSANPIVTKFSPSYHETNKICIAVTTSAFLLATICAAKPTPCTPLQHIKVKNSTTQVLVVRALGSIDANLTACERDGTDWRPAMKTVPAVIGANGLARSGEKKEGDKKSPSGLFPLGEAFGFKPRLLHMDYRYITKDDKYVDDSTSPEYNTWVVGETSECIRCTG